MTLTVLDLFSGIGGFSLGLERTGGFKTIAFCEIDPFCRKVLAKHWPEVPCYEDVEKLSLPNGFADVICGGFPCQDISVAGRGEGIKGKRSGLWKEYARLIGEVRPRYVIVENVAALLGRGLGVVLGDLAALGFDAEWHCISASSVGALHFRDRVWIIANDNRGAFRGEQNGRTIRGSEAASSNQEQGADGQRYRRRHSNEVEENSYTNDRSEREQRFFTRQIQKQPEFSWCEDVRRVEDLFDRPDLPEPLLWRKSDGVSARVDALGNAVVPQIPEIIGNAILEAT